MDSVKSRRRITSSIASLMLLLLIVVSLPALAQNSLTAEQWRHDLHYLADQIPKTHPHPFHRITSEKFDSAAAQVDAKIPTLSDHEIEVEFVRLVAMLGEGHSRLSLPGLPDPMSDVPDLTPVNNPRLAFHRLPIMLYSFSDGLFVVAATAEFRSLIGLRVLQIGGLSAQSALDAVLPIVNRDNDMGARLLAPYFVVIPEVLHALHVVADPAKVPLTLRTRTGENVTLALAPLQTTPEPVWVDAYTALPESRPLYLRQEEKNFWVEYLPDSKTAFIRINVIEDSPRQSLAGFAHELNSLVASHSVDRLVIDLRDCHGGNNQLFRSLLLWLIRDVQNNQPGKLFVIIGRSTFSAAVNAASDLERLSNCIFVGEPTAGAPSSWGDPKKITLPNSGLIARISTIYWRDWTPDESRPWIAPDVSAAVSSDDYFAGRDPAMKAILSFPAQTAFGDVLENLVQAGAGLKSTVRLYYQHKTDAAWADESTQQAMQRVGTLLLLNKSYDEALLVFKLNFRDYPGSLSAALQAAQAAQKSDPTNRGLADLVRKLNDLNEGY